MLLVALNALLVGSLIVRVLIAPNREPSARIAWVVVLLAVPLIGIVAYILFGEVRVGRKRTERLWHIESAMLPVGRPDYMVENRTGAVPERFEQVFDLGRSISGFDEVPGNTAELLESSTGTIDRMVEDIDAAERHVHIVFYIWLPDESGIRIAQALMRAARRGIVCRALADDLGSRLMIRSDVWKEMEQAGVLVARALPVDNPLLRPLFGRIDLRNHRKILVIDNRITYSGSQNCANESFEIKRKFAPWVDVMLRFEGPIANQNQRLFATDWMLSTTESLAGLLGEAPADAVEGGFAAQVVGTGPTVRRSAMPEMFSTLMYAARRELVITTPYFVPDEAIQRALCSTAHRGIDTTLVLPARNDSWEVSAASRSYYEVLLGAGVRIYEYVGGLLHAKTVTIDGELSMVGSANLDRRSFELNYENNILFWDGALSAQLRGRQQSFIDSSRRMDLREVEAWHMGKRLWNNTIAVLSPLL